MRNCARLEHAGQALDGWATLSRVAVQVPGFEVVGPVGETGEVYLARQLSPDRVVALEMLPAAYTGGEARLQRLRELEHPNLLRLLDFDFHAARPYVVHEHVDQARTLSEILASDPPPPAAALALATKLCAGLAYLHQSGVVHGDLRPAGVLVTKVGEPRIRLGPNGPGAAAGADVQALAVILHELLERRAGAAAVKELLAPFAAGGRITTKVAALGGAPDPMATAPAGSRARRLSLAELAVVSVTAGVTLALAAIAIRPAPLLWPSSATGAGGAPANAAAGARLAHKLVAAHPALDVAWLADLAQRQAPLIRAHRDPTAVAALLRAQLERAGLLADLAAFLPEAGAYFTSGAVPETERWALRSAMADLDVWEAFCDEHRIPWAGVLPASVARCAGAWDAPVEAVTLAGARTWTRPGGPLADEWTLPPLAPGERALAQFEVDRWRAGLVLDVVVNGRFRRVLRRAPLATFVPAAFLAEHTVMQVRLVELPLAETSNGDPAVAARSIAFVSATGPSRSSR